MTGHSAYSSAQQATNVLKSVRTAATSFWECCSAMDLPMKMPMEVPISLLRMQMKIEIA